MDEMEFTEAESNMNDLVSYFIDSVVRSLRVSTTDLLRIRISQPSEISL